MRNPLENDAQIFATPQADSLSPYAVRRLLLIDLDGTIRQCKSDPTGFINSPQDQELILGVSDRLSEYQDNGWIIVGVSNQGGVAAGFKSLVDCFKEMQHTLRLAPQLSEIYFCPDAGESCWRIRPFRIGRLFTIHRRTEYLRSLFPWMQSGFRKPECGMLSLAIDHFAGIYYQPGAFRCPYWNCSTQAFEMVWMVGDRPEDQQAALSLGVPFLDAATWRITSLNEINLGVEC